VATSGGGKTNGVGSSTTFLVDNLDHHHSLNKEKEVSFANGIITSSSSPPTPSRAGLLRYPVDVVQVPT
jgi:hypothetical protein